MATRTVSAAGGFWDVTTTWAEGVVPTSSDDVVANVASGNFTIRSAASCASYNGTNHAGSCTHNALTTWTIGGSAAGAGNSAMTMGSTNYILGDPATSAIVFGSTSTTQQTIDFGGKTVGNVTIGTSGRPNYAFVSAINQGATATFTSTFGDIYLDGASSNLGLTHTLGRWVASASNARSMNAGPASVFNIIGTTAIGNVVNWTNSANLTTNLSGATFNITTNTPGMDGIGATWGNKFVKEINMSGSVARMGNLLVNCVNYRQFAPTSAPVIQDNFICGGNITGKVSGLLLLYGYSEAYRCVMNGTNGVVSTLDITGATLDFKWVSFVDFQFTRGAALDFTNPPAGVTVSGYVGDLGGNSIVGGYALTFTPGTTCTWVDYTTSGSTNDPSRWTPRVPLPQDLAVFNGTFTGGPTISCGSSYHLGAVDFSGSTGTVTLASGVQVSTIMRYFKGRSGLTFSSPTISSVQTNWWWYDRTGNGQIYLNGTTSGGTMAFSCGAGGKFSFMDSGNFGASAISIRTGNVTISAGNTVNVASWTSTANITGLPATLTVETGAVAGVSASGTVISMAATANTFSVRGGGSILISNTSSTNKNVYLTGNVTIEPRIIFNGGTGALNIGPSAGSVLSILGITMPNGGTLQMGAGTTLNWAGSGEATFGNGSNAISLKSATAGSATSFTKTGGGRLITDYATIQDVSAANAPFFAGANSTLVSGNSGWTGPATVPAWTPQAA